MAILKCAKGVKNIIFQQYDFWEPNKMRFNSLVSGALAIVPLALSTSAIADTELYKDSSKQLLMRGYFSVDYLYSDSDDALSDSTSRIGFHFTSDFADKWKAVGGIEWGVDIVDAGGDFQFSQGDGFQPDDERGDNIWSRLGYVGAKHETYGSLTFGKQWGVYYDVTWMTDNFESFGGEASGTYNFFTDGGASGTGRADEAIQYRNSFGDFSVGLQYQPGEEDINFDDLDAIGLPTDAQAKFDNRWSGSLVYDSPFGVSAGIAYSSVDITTNFPTVDDDDNTALALGINYGSLSGEGLYAAAVYVVSENHEIDDTGTIFDAEGLELQVRWGFTDTLYVYGGYNHLEEDDSNYGDAADEQFELEYMILGAGYTPISNFFVYTEWKLDDSTSSDGASGDDVYGVGMRYNF